MQSVRVGTQVIWTDENRNDAPGFVTAVHGETREYDGGVQQPCVNLVFLSLDESKVDPYGRQIERQSSAPHASGQTGGGFCWRFLDEPKPERADVQR